MESNCYFVYRTRVIISRGLYIFYPFFTSAYNQQQLILKTIYLVNKEILQKKSVYKSGAGYNGACTVYIFNQLKLTLKNLIKVSFAKNL